MNKETFCALPFTEIFLGPDGIVKPCCSSNTAFGDLNQSTIQEIIQSERSREVRSSILRGEWHPSCIQCKRQESQGIRSERDLNMDKFIADNGTVDETFFKLVRLDLRWSNTCNLSCTYCYEYFSSKWAEIKGIKVNAVVDENEQSLFLLIEQHKDSVENILMLGGEPLLQKQNARLIDLVANKSFYVLTNLAVPLPNNRVAQRLLKEPVLHIGVSFETIGERYEYVRHGAQWAVFDSNIDYIRSQRKDVEIDAHALYSIYSAFNLVEYYEYIVSKQITKVFWNLLESSGENKHASVFKLSRTLKDEAIAEIDRVLERFPTAPGVSDLVSIRATLLEDSPMTDKMHEFIDEAAAVEAQLNKGPGKRLKDLWPDLYRKLSMKPTPTIPVSWGELLDKITILEIKQDKIVDEIALANVNKELEYLNIVANFGEMPKAVIELLHDLREVNTRLWKVEDDIREAEALQQFDANFIELARSVYRLNDIRAKTKKAINQLVGSELVEEKLYKNADIL